jgi:hypothetical protein
MVRVPLVAAAAEDFNQQAGAPTIAPSATITGACIDKREEQEHMATYHVVPFAASVAVNEGAGHAAAQLEALIKSWSDQGWEYVRLESVETYVAGSPGCFGLGATQPRLVSYSMAVFKQ